MDRCVNRSQFLGICPRLDRGGNRGQIKPTFGQRWRQRPVFRNKSTFGQRWQQRPVFRNKPTFWTEVATGRVFRNKPSPILNRGGNRGKLSEISPLSGKRWQQRHVFKITPLSRTRIMCCQSPFLRFSYVLTKISQKTLTFNSRPSQTSKNIGALQALSTFSY